MKTVLRLAALFAFGCCFIAGMIILRIAGQSGLSDAPVAAALGLVLVGMAFFSGGLLLVAAEKSGSRPGADSIPLNR